MHPLLQKDINDFIHFFRFGVELSDSTFLITGATGLIGSMLIHCLISLGQGIHIIAPVRNIHKANAMFDETELKQIDFIDCDLCSYDYGSLFNIDYIVHCAAPTDSRYFVEHSVETSTFIYKSTEALLRFAHHHPVRSFVYLSSLEVYGQIMDDCIPVKEDMYGYIDPLSARSSYPIAKLAAENLCVLYARQYGIPAKIARLTQISGVGVSFDDNRVINQFSRKAAMAEDIVLHTRGESARPYCYTLDAIDAILTILLKGEASAAYNVANESTYISAFGMAEFLHNNYAPSIQIHTNADSSHGYAPETRLRLSSAKLRQLGWQPRYDLKMTFDRLIPWLLTSLVK